MPGLRRARLAGRRLAAGPIRRVVRSSRRRSARIDLSSRVRGAVKATNEPLALQLPRVSDIRSRTLQFVLTDQIESRRGVGREVRRRAQQRIGRSRAPRRPRDDGRTTRDTFEAGRTETRMRWRVLIVVAAVMAAVVPLPPALVERYYSTLLYPSIQRTLTGLSNLTNVALLDALIAAALAVWVLLFLRDVMVRPGRTARRPLVRLRVADRDGGGLFLPAVPRHLGVELPSPAAGPEARARRGIGLAAGRRGSRDDGGGRDEPALPDRGRSRAGSRAQTRRSRWSGHLRTLSGCWVRPRRPARGVRSTRWLNWYFRRAAIDGMTDPYFLETLVLDGAPAGGTADRHRPRVGASGRYADEGEANFVGWLACLQGVAAGPLQRMAVSLQPDGRWTALVRAVAHRRR